MHVDIYKHPLTSPLYTRVHTHTLSTPTRSLIHVCRVHDATANYRASAEDNVVKKMMLIRKNKELMITKKNLDRC